MRPKVRDHDSVSADLMNYGMPLWSCRRKVTPVLDVVLIAGHGFTGLAQGIKDGRARIELEELPTQVRLGIVRMLCVVVDIKQHLSFSLLRYMAISVNLPQIPPEIKIA